jgi:hypothetical protein
LEIWARPARLHGIDGSGVAFEVLENSCDDGGASKLATTRNGLLQRRQDSMSMANTRLMHWPK